MLNRRFLRIKAMQEVYACQQSKETDLMKGERHLLKSVDDLYELFVCLLSFWVEVKRFAERRIEENKNKNFPTQEDLNPNLKFVNNRVLNVLDQNKHLSSLEQQFKINWADYREDFIRGFYVKLTQYPEYQEYMNSKSSTFSNDRNFLADVIDKYMAEDDVLFDFFADRSLTFNSDYQLGVYLLWKFIKEMPASFDADTKLPPVYKTEEEDENKDRRFVVDLFRKTMLHNEEYQKMLAEKVSNWDYDRLALMDQIIMTMAVTEFCDFPSVPIKVTINEYIEISKFYSTPESHRFVNGMLDKMAQVLKEEGKIKKSGRGLIDK